jgi:hypothetical protein
MNKRDKPLVNPTWEEMVEKDPLIAFSWYLSGRVRCVVELGTEVLVNLDAAHVGDGLDGGSFARAEMMMWFWVLGAYEVVRTMCQAKGSFRSELMQKLTKLKKELSRARMPAAKMEVPGKRKPVTSNRSPAVWDLPNRDLLIGDSTTEMISTRGLLKQFENVISSITPADILSRHEESYKR